MLNLDLQVLSGLGTIVVAILWRLLLFLKKKDDMLMAVLREIQELRRAADLGSAEREKQFQRNEKRLEDHEEMLDDHEVRLTVAETTIKLMKI